MKKCINCLIKKPRFVMKKPRSQGSLQKAKILGKSQCKMRVKVCCPIVLTVILGTFRRIFNFSAPPRMNMFPLGVYTITGQRRATPLRGAAWVEANLPVISTVIAQFLLQIHNKKCLTLKMKVSETKHNIRNSMAHIKIDERHYSFMRY